MGSRRARWAGPALIAGVGLGVLVSFFAQPRRDSTSPAPTLTPAVNKPAEGETLSFNRDIRPILSEKCFACHGPDAAVSDKMGGFRLDTRDTAVVPTPASGKTPIVPGDADASQIIHRITSAKPNLVMPPPKAKMSVTEAEVELLKRWIKAGAAYEGHWAYQTPVKPVPPTTRHEDWVRNDIDRFIAKRLEQAGLSPSEEAGRATLIRRLSLDLIGLPPTPTEIDAFINDPSPDAYEKLVDRLLASPHFGERMALPWLDAARYADTIGYQLDHYKSAWPYRDYVIKSFNDNKPYDRFLVEQLAGDLLPDATDEQRLATAFCRMHMMNHEGGSIDEEFRVVAVADRIETVATVFMAQTYNCAMCHDHKYDPTTQQDYYNLFKYFHNINERGIWTNRPERAVAYGDRVRWYTPEQRVTLEQAQATHNQAVQARQDAAPMLQEQQKAWEQSLRDRHGVTWAKTELKEAKSTQFDAGFAFKPDGSVLLTNRDVPAKENLTLVITTEATGLRLIKLDALTDPRNNGWIDRGYNGSAQPTHIKVTAISIVDPTQKQTLTFQWAWATQSNTDKKKNTLGPMNLLKPGTPGWSTGSRQDPKPSTLLLVASQPFGFKGGSELRVVIEHQAGGKQTLGRVRLGFAGARASVIEAFPDTEEAQKARQDKAIALQPLALIEPGGRTAHSSKTLAELWGRANSPRFEKLSKAVEDAERALKRAQDAAVPVSVMKELDKPTPMFVLERGVYSKPIKDRPARLDLPSFIDLPLPEGAPNNRLGFAQWLTRPDHPLTARVHANRLWQMLFGMGIVATVEDFGSQAAWPSHPDLLDYLAVTFVESGWDQKALIKSIVMSATYRQRAELSQAATDIDADNRLLSSFPRRRMPGELIRDQALFVSGLLNETIGGPSVKPYQPAGLWREVSMGPRSNTNVFKRDDGDKLYRRSLYTFIKRKSPPPQMQSFGAPNREACVVRRGVTNTPLQALVLWNDEQFLETARVLAQRTLAQAESDKERAAMIYRRYTGDEPNDRQVGVLLDALAYYRDRYSASPDDAQSLLKQGTAPLPEAYEPAELAAWMMVASTVQSLDQTIVRD